MNALTKKMLLAAPALLLLAACGGAKPPEQRPAPVPTGTVAAARGPGATPAPEPPPPRPAPMPGEEWRAERPKSGPTPAPTLPVFQRDKLANGLTVLVSEVHTLPLASFVVVTKGGSALDPKDRDGVTSLSYVLLGEGAGKRDSMAFSDAVADLGADFSSGADQDAGSVRISGLSRNRDAMLGLLADALLRPQLTPRDFDRMKQQTISGIKARRGSPDGLAFERVPALIYGAEHPYGHPTVGTEPTVEKVSLEDVKAQLAKILVPGNSALIATGDIDMKEAKRLAQKHLGAWRGEAPPVKKHPMVEPAPRKTITILHKANAPQTMVVTGRPIFGRGHDDEVPLQVTNLVFGGSFTSRLNMNLREEKGYTYGAFSAATLRHGVGGLLSYSKIRADVTAPAIQEVIKELEGMVKNPPSSEEVDRAKDGLIRSLPGEFERTGAIAGAAATLFVYDMPLDHYARLPEQVSRVDPATVARMAERYMPAALMQILLVGDSAAIQGPVKALGLGEVVVKEP